MNPVVTVNVGGKALQLEAPAYDALRAYLASAESSLGADPDKTEILGDIEQAIAEKSVRYLSAAKDVITASDMKTILDEMGPVGASERVQAEHSRQQTRPKRLYLIREGAMIAGVCTGLGAYFGIDANIVRLIFVALAMLTGGGWLLAYFALALLIPHAETAEEQAEAHGIPFNAQELVNRAKTAYAQFTDESGARTTEWKQNLKQWKRDRRAERRAWKQAYGADRYRSPWSALFGLLAGLLGLLWIFALLSLIATGALFGILLPAAIPLWLAIILLFVFFHAVTGPLQASRSWGHPGWFALVDAATVAFILIALLFVYVHYPAVQEFFQAIIERIRALFA